MRFPKGVNQGLIRPPGSKISFNSLAADGKNSGCSCVGFGARGVSEELPLSRCLAPSPITEPLTCIGLRDGTGPTGELS